MVEAVLIGIIAKINELTEGSHNTFYTAIGGRFYDTEAPEGTNLVFPYGVITTGDTVPLPTFDRNVYLIGFMVNLYSNTRSNTEIDDVFGKFCSLFEPAAGATWTTLTVTGYTTVMVRMESWRRLRMDGAWMYSIDLAVRIRSS